MRIAFICSSLEPGQDGAGDQIRRLAAEMIKIGHQSVIIALHDRKTNHIFQGFQSTLGVDIPTLRLPALWAAAKRFTVAKEYLADFSPDWVSLHYVNWGFNKYGLPTEMITSFRKIIGKAKLNIMLWELWCGLANSKNLKEDVLGYFQKIYLRLMLVACKPDSLFTSTNFFAEKLRKIGLNATVVPVVGNIPLGDFGSEDDWNRILNDSKLSEIADKKSLLIVGFFGAFYPCPGLDQLVKNLFEASKVLQKKLYFLRVGNNRGKDTLDDILKGFPEVSYYKTGILEPDMVNRCLSFTDMGIITVTANCLTKSSSAVAWFERGIPVLISKEDNTYDKEEMVSEGAFQIKAPEDIIKIYKMKLSPKNPVEMVLRIYNSLYFHN